MKVLCDGVDEGVDVVLLCGGLTLLSKNENPRSVQLQNPKPLLSPFQPAVCSHCVWAPAAPRSFKGKSCLRGKEEPNHNFRLTPHLKVQRAWVFCFSGLCFV